ncbi:hypothetical protein G9C98_000824 [Cotesia typhae]|uniref:EB domain-containing protein n=1 Tax=Cotesia typhae TaxID=2053667 RepID=A0A8J5RHR7_9HYME|nr:hypothetical protein G9C98_000824 [Cotesia typhae]
MQRIGSGCVTNENCQDLNNTLCKSGKCECLKGYWKANETCQLVTNTTCINHSDCKESGAKCLLNNCVLPSEFFVESNTRNATLYAAKRKTLN